MRNRKKSRAGGAGRRISELVKATGTTLRTLASQIGVSEATMYAYSSGALAVPESRVSQIAAALKVTPDVLLAGSTPDLEDSTRVGAALIDAHLSQSNPDEAVRIAMDLIEEVQERSDLAAEAELKTKAGRALVMQGEYLRAIAQLDLAASYYRASGADSGLAKCAQLLGFAYTSIGEISAAERCFLEADSTFADEEKWRARVALAALDERAGRFSSAHERLEELEASPLIPTQAAYVCFNRASLSGTKGFWKDCLSQNQIGLSLATDLQLSDQIGERLLQITQSLIHCGDFEQASVFAIRGLDRCDALGDKARRAFIRLLTAQMLARCGHSAEARDIALTELENCIRHQYRRSETLALETLCIANITDHDWIRASEYAIQLRANCEAHNFSVMRIRALAYLLQCQVHLESDLSSELEDVISAVEDLDALGEPKALALFALAQKQIACHKPDDAKLLVQRALESAVSAGALPLVQTICAEFSNHFEQITVQSRPILLKQRASEIETAHRRQFLLLFSGGELKKLSIGTATQTGANL